MKIGNLAERLASVAGTASAAGVRGAQDAAGQAKGTQPAPQGAAAPGGGSATVQLSSAATALLEGAEGGFDAEKVKRVRDAIADGTYRINPEAIADKLIANAQELLGKRSGPA
jgi:negative regulator of flagellin synthesis FlgM